MLVSLISLTLRTALELRPLHCSAAGSFQVILCSSSTFTSRHIKNLHEGRNRLSTAMDTQTRQGMIMFMTSSHVSHALQAQTRVKVTQNAIFRLIQEFSFNLLMSRVTPIFHSRFYSLRPVASCCHHVKIPFLPIAFFTGAVLTLHLIAYLDVSWVVFC